MPRDGIGKIPTYVKRSRALKSARSFSPKFRAGRDRAGTRPQGLERLVRRVLALVPALRHPLTPDALRRARVGHIDQFQGVRILTIRNHGPVMRNLLALPTLDMYLPLSNI